MATFINHYLILGLPSGEEAFKISKTEITKAYRLKALEIHPDKRRDDPNAVVGFQKLQASYEILKNDNSRKVFDASLMIRIQQQKDEQQTQKDKRRRSDVGENSTGVMSEDDKTRRWRMMCGHDVARRWGRVYDHEERDRVVRRKHFVRKESVIRWK